jgi:hypothetical protein
VTSRDIAPVCQKTDEKESPERLFDPDSEVAGWQLSESAASGAAEFLLRKKVYDFRSGRNQVATLGGVHLADILPGFPRVPSAAKGNHRRTKRPAMEKQVFILPQPI